jgi:hypothetical protein
MSKRKVLVTGASGYVASQLLPALRERYDLTLIDTKKEQRSGSVVEDIILADVANAKLDELRPHFKGVQTVVHLAYVHPSAREEVERYHSERINVDMAYKVYRLALEEGAERVVMASSNHAADWYEHLIRARKLDMVYPDATPPHSDNFYGWAKIVYEEMGFVFASGRCGRKLGVVQIRIGAPREIVVERFRASNNVVGYKRDLGAYVSERDLQQLFIKSIATENIENEHGVPFQVFYGVSENSRSFWSIANARRVIGYAPQDDAEVKYAKDIAEWLANEEGGKV